MAIADQLDRLNVLRRNLADTLTEKGVEAAETEGLETLVPKVGTIETGIQLPELTNPASATDILSGKQAINAAGEVVTGTGNFVVKEEKTVTVERGGRSTVSITRIPQMLGIKALKNGASTYTGALVTPSQNSSQMVDYLEVMVSASKIVLTNASGGSYYSVTLYIYY